MAGAKHVFKHKVVLVPDGRTCRVYGSVDELPGEVRRSMDDATLATIVIADRETANRAKQAIEDETPTPAAAPAAAPAPTRIWVEFAAAGAAILAILWIALSR